MEGLRLLLRQMAAPIERLDSTIGKRNKGGQERICPLKIHTRLHVKCDACVYLDVI